MKKGDFREIDCPCESGSLNIVGWAADRSGNPATISFNTEYDVGFGQMTINGAKKVIADLTALVAEVENAQ